MASDEGSPKGVLLQDSSSFLCRQAEEQQEAVESSEGLENMEATPEVMCRICYSSEGEDLISPCECRGTQKYIHRSCLDDWRRTRGRIAIFQCSTCHAPFHLRMPRRVPGSFIIAAVVKGVAAVGMFVGLQFVPLILGYLVSGDILQESFLDVPFEAGVLCYCAGMWELLLSSAFGCVLDLERWYWRWCFFGALSILRHAVLQPAVDGIFVSCYYKDFDFPVPFPDSNFQNSSLGIIPDNAAVGAAASSCPMRQDGHPSCLPLELEGSSAACAVIVGGVLGTLALGFIGSIYAVSVLMSGTRSWYPASRDAIVKELEVLDTGGDYSPPQRSVHEERVLQTLSLLT